MNIQECHITISSNQHSMKIGFERNDMSVKSIMLTPTGAIAGYTSTRIIEFSSDVKLPIGTFKVGDTLKVLGENNETFKLKINSILLENSINKI